VDYALTLSGDDDFVVALNNDLTFGADLLEALMEGSRKYPGAIVSAVVCDAGRRDRVLDAGQFFDGTTTQRPLRPGQEANLDVNVATGRGVLFPAAVFRKAGNYARRSLPHYHADFEMALRAQRYGFYLVTYYPAKVYLRLDTTGFGESLFQKRTLRELWALAWSRKSVRDVRSTIAFLVLAVPWRCVPKYVVKELVYAFWIYTGFTPLWQLRQPLQILCKRLFPRWYDTHNVAKLYEDGGEVA
jgi:GT2 family glycosyltransferase